MAFLLSHFTAHFDANRRYMPRAVARAILTAAAKRLGARQAAGYAERPLLFDDLIDRIEQAVAGGSFTTDAPDAGQPAGGVVKHLGELGSRQPSAEVAL